MKVAKPILKCSVPDLIIDEHPVVCVFKQNKHHVFNVNTMPYLQAKALLENKDTLFYEVIEVKK